MTTAAQNRHPGIAAALEIVQSSLVSAERALSAGAEVDLAPLEEQIRALCLQSSKAEASERRIASETLSQVLERLSLLEAAVVASGRR